MSRLHGILGLLLLVTAVLVQTPLGEGEARACNLLDVERTLKAVSMGQIPAEVSDILPAVTPPVFNDSRALSFNSAHANSQMLSLLPKIRFEDRMPFIAAAAQPEYKLEQDNAYIAMTAWMRDRSQTQLIKAPLYNSLDSRTKRAFVWPTGQEKPDTDTSHLVLQAFEHDSSMSLLPGHSLRVYRPPSV